MIFPPALLRLLSGTVALVCSAAATERFYEQDYSRAYLVSGLAATVVLTQLILEHKPGSTIATTSDTMTILPVRWQVLAISLVGVVATVYLAYHEIPGLLSLIPWLVAVVASIIAFDDHKYSLWRWNDNVVAASLFVVALASRIIGLYSVPFGIHGDEADWGLLALRIWRGEGPVFAYVWLGYPGTSLVPYALTLGLLGQSLLAVRLASGIIGALVVPMLYVLGKQTYGRMVGVFAALFLLGNVSNFHFDRMGLPNVEALPVMVLGSIALVAALRRPSRLRMWAVLGLSLGLSLEAYLTALVWLPVAFTALAPVAVAILRGDGRRRFLVGGLVALLAFMVTASPMLTFVFRHPGTLGARASSIAIWSEEGRSHSADAFGIAPSDTVGLWKIQVQRSLEALHSRGDSSQQYNGQRGMLDPVAGVAFIIGCAVLLNRWRSSTSVLIVSWLVLTLFLGSVVIIDPPFAPRLVGLAPVACLVAGIGIERLWHGVVGLHPDRDRIVSLLGTACILIGAALGFSYYFGVYRQQYPNQEITALALYLQSVQVERTAYFVGLGDPTDYATIRFIAPAAQVLRWDLDTPVPPPASKRLLSFLMPVEGQGSVRSIALTDAQFPSGDVRYLTNVVGRQIVRLKEVSSPSP